MEEAARVAGRLRERLLGQGDAALPRSGEQGRASKRRAPEARSSRSTCPIPPGPFPTALVRSTNVATDWAKWLVDDQREASGRTDVAVFVSDGSTTPLKISGQPIANLVASTSGTDSDWVVKLIDVYPDEVAGQPAMGGYQLMVAADVFRGRYRESFETPKAIEAGQAAALQVRAADREPRLPARATG